MFKISALGSATWAGTRADGPLARIEWSLWRHIFTQHDHSVLQVTDGSVAGRPAANFHGAELLLETGHCVWFNKSILNSLKRVHSRRVQMGIFSQRKSLSSQRLAVLFLRKNTLHLMSSFESFNCTPLQSVYYPNGIQILICICCLSCQREWRQTAPYLLKSQEPSVSGSVGWTWAMQLDAEW